MAGTDSKKMERADWRNRASIGKASGVTSRCHMIDRGNPGEEQRCG